MIWTFVLKKYWLFKVPPASGHVEKSKGPGFGHQNIIGHEYMQYEDYLIGRDEQLKFLL